MQAVEAELSGQAGKFRSFWREELTNGLFRLLILNSALRPTRQRL